MGTGLIGTFVISWSQTEIDGLEDAPLDALRVGATWQWQGDAVCVDGPARVLRLEPADDVKALRRRAARKVQRLVGAAISAEDNEDVDLDQDAPLLENSFVVTDGARSFTVTLIEAGIPGRPLLMFHNDVPPPGRDLWVVHYTRKQALTQDPEQNQKGVICFTQGTRLRTVNGLKRVEDLCADDLLQTKDNGLQPIRWIGQRQMTGARLFAMPTLRPIRILAGHLGEGTPDQDLLVSPHHRVLVKGAAARELYNTDEVFVTARDLIDGRSVTVDIQARGVTYIHLMLDQHEVLFANGVETESFHPASTSMAALDGGDRRRLLRAMPVLDQNPESYGGYARRMLSASEAAILRHAA